MTFVLKVTIIYTMIKIVFPPGCYGTYLARCIYTYTNLRQEEFIPLDFDEHGGNHAYRDKNIGAHQFIKIGHLDTIDLDSEDTVIALLPDNDHNLDYYNNQFFKQYKGQLISYIKDQLSEKQISEKFKNQWGLNDDLTDLTPRWVLREWCSFWLVECWRNSYSVENYSTISNSTQVNTTQMVENFDTVFYKLINDLKLTLTVDPAIINQTHANFFVKQKFHNSQLRCQQWINKVFDSAESSEINIDTIFDEAYLQYLLRVQGFEIECDGLNQFPFQPSELKKIIYQP